MKKDHLPLFGVGPLYVCVVAVLTVVAVLVRNMPFVGSGRIEGARVLFVVIGFVVIALGVVLWLFAVLGSKIDDNILRNSLVTTGVYAWVRNPIYSAFMLISTGVILIIANLWLFIVPAFDWIFMTVLMKKTEEKWLTDLFGQEYIDYCSRVNRCWPWFPSKA